MNEERFLEKYDRMGLDCFVAAAVVAGVTGVGSAIAGGISSSKAAGAQSAAAQQAATLQQQQYQQNRTDQQPYMQAGQGALNTITQDQANGTGFAKQFNMSDFYNDPGYKFQLQQGQNAINNSSAATGGVLNGGTLKALSQYTSGLANQTYGDAYNRYLANSQQQYGQLFNVAQLGENATSTLGNQGVTSANNAGNYLTQAGNAKAAGDVGVGNAISSGINSAGLLGYAVNQSQSGYGSSSAKVNPFNPFG